MHGAGVEVAHSGAAELARSQVFQPQIPILDIGMPGMDGYELARRVIEEAHRPSPFFIALTGWGQAEDRARIVAAGFKVDLVKPLSFADLAQALSQVQRK